MVSVRNGKTLTRTWAMVPEKKKKTCSSNRAVNFRFINGFPEIRGAHTRAETRVTRRGPLIIHRRVCLGSQRRRRWRAGGRDLFIFNSDGKRRSVNTSMTPRSAAVVRYARRRLPVKQMTSR